MLTSEFNELAKQGRVQAKIVANFGGEYWWAVEAVCEISVQG